MDLHKAFFADHLCFRIAKSILARAQINTDLMDVDVRKIKISENPRSEKN